MLIYFYVDGNLCKKVPEIENVAFGAREGSFKQAAELSFELYHK